METKDVVILGLGRFGSSMAMQLEANGCKVLAVDSNEKKVRQIADYVTLASCGDVTDGEVMGELGLHNFDTAVIAIGHNTEASILATLYVKEHGVKHVIAKALNEVQGQILKKIGADEVVYPEMEMGIRTANRLTMNNLIDAVELADEYSIAKIPAIKEWVGKSLRELNLRDKFKVNVIAIQKDKKMQMVPDADEKIDGTETFALLGTNQMLKKLAEKSKRS